MILSRLAVLIILVMGIADELPRVEPSNTDSGPGEEVIVFETPFSSAALAGVVVDPAGYPIPGVTVQRTVRDWRKVIESTSTDKDGRFSFPAQTKGKHFLRFSKNGFKVVCIKVVIRKSEKKELQVHLPLA